MTTNNENFTKENLCDTVTKRVGLDSNKHMYASTEAMDRVQETLVELQREIKQLRQWLAGGVDNNGRPIPGVLQTIDQIRSARKWILGLLGAIAVSSIANAAASLVHQAKLP